MEKVFIRVPPKNKAVQKAAHEYLASLAKGVGHSLDITLGSSDVVNGLYLNLKGRLYATTNIQVYPEHGYTEIFMKNTD